MSRNEDSDNKSKTCHNAFGINDRNLFWIADLAKDFAIYKGICKRSSKLHFDAREPVAFCLVPSAFPEVWFNYVRDIQPHLNYVLHKIAHSPDFLYSCLESMIKEDDFLAKIWNIYETVQEEEPAQSISLGLLRCDYMLHTNDKGEVIGIKGVENNTFASSFSGLSTNVSNLHTYVLDKLGMKDISTRIPENGAFYDLPKGMIAAWDLYGKRNAAVLFVVEDITYNICDQRALEFAIWELEKDITVLRYTFSELRTSAVLQDNCLFVDGKEIAIVYYRYGYVPAHYTPEDWELRLMMERSSAIKCPSAGYHLAGTKRVQLQLTKPGVLEKFLPDGVDPNHIREVFAKQYSLEMNKEGDEAVAMAICNPDLFVLKPEREGGGFNIFGEEIKTQLESIGKSKSRTAYILMEKIRPPHIRNCIIRSQIVPQLCDVVCELGIYGVIIGTKDKICKNYHAGHLVKSKEVGTNEGGIVAGFGAMDSPFLT